MKLIASPKQDKKKKKGNEPAIPPQQKLLNPTERTSLNAELQKQRMDAIIASFPDAAAQMKRVHFIIDKSSDITTGCEKKYDDDTCRRGKKFV